MKKFVFPMLVAMVAAFTFVSCGEKELTADELVTKLLSNGIYIGTDNAADAATLTFIGPAVATTIGYALVYDELGSFSEGTCVVGEDGTIAFAGIDGESPNGTGTYSKGGDALELTFGAIVFNLKKK
jgi:hypothetical protein